MDIKGLSCKVKETVIRYKYAAIVLAIGLLLLLIPGKSVKEQKAIKENEPTQQTVSAESLSQILQAIEGAGKVEVLLSVSSGEKTVYQTDVDQVNGGEGSNRTQTVIITDSQRNEAGLVSQVIPPTYLGAVIVCQGADSAAVRFAVTQAVAKITGLGADKICVLKMK